MVESTKKQALGLGRGLNDIHAGLDELLTTLTHTDQVQESQSIGTQRLSIEQIQPGVMQPRRTIDPESLKELSQSIRQHGILQPLIVRPVSADRYELIAGERRWQAAKLAHCEDVPVIVRDISDQTAMAMALIENIQREDLNVMDQALGLERLLNEFGLTHEQVAQSLGKSRTTVTNLLRLLQLDETIKPMVASGQLSMGHARCLLPLPANQQIAIAKEIVAEQLSVRAVEQKVTRLKNGVPNKGKEQSKPSTDWIQATTAQLQAQFDLPIKVKPKDQHQGSIVIEYRSITEMEALIDRFKKIDGS